IRRTDMAFRLGGDEFVIVAPDMLRVEDGASLADKLLRAVSEPLSLPGNDHLVISASLGLAVFPANGEDADHLIRAADSAMYDAKRRGRNRFCFYEPAMAERVLERLQLEQGLRQALELGQLALHYQPIMSLIQEPRMLGVEALLRWQPSSGEPVPPSRFIPVAEESGLIEPLGRWVLHQACRQGAAWLAQGHELSVSVNVSARQFAADDFIDTVKQVLFESGLPPRLLELEITESVLQEIELSQRVLWQLRAMGIRVAVDDFGTGFSSLSLLKHLPLDRIKIDQSFIRDLPGSANDVAITRAIIGLSQTLELEVTAEGIETQAQLDFLRSHGCPAGQGYHFSRPVPPDQLRLP
ncbi:MAG: bifunctional diguanylate cyclase/phosphodiesterase, partial [Curvibacter sp.]|nr:bifunctional diguanylate cyclase/phosphodiesterase [Curvibacter sp.]